MSDTNVKVTAEQLAAYQKLATEALSSFEETVTVKRAPAVEVSDADREFVKTALAKLTENPGAWLKSKLPVEIPGEIAAKMLDHRYAVIRAACVELGLVARRAGASESNHVLKFRVTKPEPKSDAPKADETPKSEASKADETPKSEAPKADETPTRRTRK